MLLLWSMLLALHWASGPTTPDGLLMLDLDYRPGVPLWRMLALDTTPGGLLMLDLDYRPGTTPGVPLSRMLALDTTALCPPCTTTALVLGWS